MKPNMPFFDFATTVPLRDLVPEEKVEGGRASVEDMEGKASSVAKGRSSEVMGAGTERRLVAGEEDEEGKMSLSVAVLAREGRGGGGGETMVVVAAAANGSLSTRAGGGADERLCLRARGGGFWRELRTRSEGVFDLKEGGGGGGGGACLVGWNAVGSFKLASLRRSEYSWMDSREGRWYSIVILDCRLEGW